jgi:hypothetical protein
MANQDDSFMRELEEELRRERIEKIWKEYGTYLLAGALIIVVGVLGYKYVERTRLVSAQTMGARYESALTLAQEGKDGSAAKEFETIATEGSGYGALARLQFAGSLLKQGKKPEALAAYEALANDSGADQLLREFAAVQAAAVRLGEADFTEMQNRLTPLMGDAQPWRYSARELLGLAAFKAGNEGEARIILTPLLVDHKTPQSILERAQIVLAEIASGEIAKKAGNEAPAPAAKAAEGTPAVTAPEKTKKE